MPLVADSALKALLVDFTFCASVHSLNGMLIKEVLPKLLGASWGCFTDEAFEPFRFAFCSLQLRLDGDGTNVATEAVIMIAVK